MLPIAEKGGGGWTCGRHHHRGRLSLRNDRVLRAPQDGRVRRGVHFHQLPCVRRRQRQQLETDTAASQLLLMYDYVMGAMPVLLRCLSLYVLRCLMVSYFVLFCHSPARDPAAFASTGACERRSLLGQQPRSTSRPIATISPAESQSRNWRLCLFSDLPGAPFLVRGCPVDPPLCVSTLVCPP